MGRQGGAVQAAGLIEPSLLILVDVYQEKESRLEHAATFARSADFA